MSQKTIKPLFASVLVVSAFGAIALKVAWATPPKGLAQTLSRGRWRWRIFGSFTRLRPGV
jgi:hypothetical protein